MRDVVLVTVDSVRRDFVDAMPFVAGHDVLTGVTAGHYTRPSLAALQSARLRGAVETRAVGPTLATALSDAGYTTIGLVPTAQADPAFGFDAGFDHYDNYMSGSGNPAKSRRSRLREYLGSFDLVRQAYRRLYPMAANMDDLPDDDAVVDEAVERFGAADSPRFLWIHLMGAHRPYGTGDQRVPDPLDRKAEAAGGRNWFDPFADPVTDAERDIILERYREALGRADDRIERLFDRLDATDPVVAITADHGDEFGEEGYFYHQGYRRRVADTLTRVPVALDGVESAGEHCSLLDIAPTLTGAVGVDPPDAWQGNDLRTTRTEEALTVAPWHDTATVAWQSFDPTRKLVARDAAVTMTGRDGGSAVERADTSEAVREQLRDLGYTDAG